LYVLRGGEKARGARRWSDGRCGRVSGACQQRRQALPSREPDRAKALASNPGWACCLFGEGVARVCVQAFGCGRVCMCVCVRVSAPSLVHRVRASNQTAAPRAARLCILPLPVGTHRSGRLAKRARPCPRPRRRARPRWWWGSSRRQTSRDRGGRNRRHRGYLPSTCRWPGPCRCRRAAGLPWCCSSGSLKSWQGSAVGKKGCGPRVSRVEARAVARARRGWPPTHDSSSRRIHVCTRGWPSGPLCRRPTTPVMIRAAASTARGDEGRACSRSTSAPSGAKKPPVPV
jgi:hypothetical protein